jgi:protein SCO1
MKYQTVPMTLLCSAVLLLTGRCALASNSPSDAANGPVTTYPAQGVVEKIAPNHRQMTVHHQAIPGYMMEMTMNFPVKNPEEIAAITVGDKIAFTLNVGKETEWIDHIRPVGHSDKPLSSATAIPTAHLAKLKLGDKRPDGEFIAANCRILHFSDFRGKVVAFTFFFTRCPIPDYCPLMNRNFEKTRALLLSSPADASKWLLLSLSFDGSFDHPDVLSAYAKNYRHDNPDHWLFGTASPKTLAEIGAPLGLMIMNQGNSMAHNLRTVVLDANGRVFYQFNDNSWTPSQLAEVMQEALKKTSDK